MGFLASDFMKPLKWEKIDISTHLTSEMTSFHVDTRFFYCMYTTEPLEKVYENDTDYPYYKKFNELYDMMNSEEEIDEKYLMEESRVIPFVFSIRELRDLNRAIVVNFDIKGCEWWVKYLRFYPYKGKYIVTNDCVPIEWREMTSKTFKAK